MNWVQLLYEYAVGGIFFAVTLYLCLKTGAATMQNASDRKTVYYLLFGLVGYFLATTAWIILASQ